jgi:hypothetical protein
MSIDWYMYSTPIYHFIGHQRDVLRAAKMAKRRSFTASVEGGSMALVLSFWGSPSGDEFRIRCMDTIQLFSKYSIIFKFILAPEPREVATETAHQEWDECEGGGGLNTECHSFIFDTHINPA